MTNKEVSLKAQLDSIQSIAKERTVKTQSIEYDLETLVKKIKKDVIKLDPDYQRRHRWNNETSSRLIESLILNIPIPLIYLSYDIDVDTEEEGARYSVIDGQQRLTAIVNFFENKYCLVGLDVLSALEGLYYKNLPPFLIRRLEERTIRCLRIDSTVDSQVKYDIFERLNSGSVKLESHELRNAVLRGPFNNLCKQLAEDENFRVLAQISLDDYESNNKVKKMEDVELVLRFFALIDDNYKNYKKEKDRQFKDFLSEVLKEKNKIEETSYAIYKEKFIKTMSCIRNKFGDQAFAKFKLEDGKLIKQSSFNAAVYDAITVGIASEVNQENCNISSVKVENVKNLFRDTEFYDSVSGSTLDSNKIIFRIEKVRETLRETLG